MHFKKWLSESDIKVTDRWPVNKATYDMSDPQERKRYEDDLAQALERMSNRKKMVFEKDVEEPYVITCWRGFDQRSYDRDVIKNDGRILMDSSRAMEGIFWFTHSLQSPSDFSGEGGPKEHAILYANKNGKGYLLTYPLRCVRYYKLISYDDGSSEEKFPEDSEKNNIHGKAYDLPEGWFITWQVQKFMGFKGVLSIDKSMIQMVSSL